MNCTTIPPQALWKNFVLRPNDEICITVRSVGGAMPTGRSDCMLFLKLPDGKTITVDAREDHEIGFGIQLVWRHFNPLQHKIHKGRDLIQPQMHWDEYNLRPLDVIWISHRNFGGSNEPDAQLQDHWVVVPHPEMHAFVEVIHIHAAPRTLLFFLSFQLAADTRVSTILTIGPHPLVMSRLNSFGRGIPGSCTSARRCRRCLI